MSKLDQPEIPLPVGTRIRIEKLEERTDALVPNNKDVGFWKEGIMYDAPAVDRCFDVYPTRMSDRGLRTSTVQEIIDEHTFKTHNSIYQITILDEQTAITPW